MTYEQNRIVDLLFELDGAAEDLALEGGVWRAIKNAYGGRWWSEYLAEAIGWCSR